MKGRISLALMFVVVLVSCMRRQPPPPEPTVPVVQYYEHTVRYSGETLGRIAKWYTGDTDSWKAILAANETLDPRRIQIGQVILIPKELVTREEPLPRPKVIAPPVSSPVVKPEQGTESPEPPKVEGEKVSGTESPEGSSPAEADDSAETAAVPADKDSAEKTEDSPSSEEDKVAESAGVDGAPEALDKSREKYMQELLSDDLE